MSKHSLETTRILPGMCRRMGLDETKVYERSKRLLKSRQEMGWTAADYFGGDEDYIYYYRTDELQEALEWIKGYFSSEDDGKEEEYFMILWESGLMKKLFRESLEILSCFQKVGGTYHLLIMKRFLADVLMNEKDLGALLGLSRSTVYARLHEAVIAFGLAFFKAVRPYILEEHSDGDAV